MKKSRIQLVAVFSFILNLFYSQGYALPSNIAQGKLFVGGTLIFGQPQNALDGNLSTVSGGGDDKLGGGAIAIDFGSPKNLGKIKITFGSKDRPAQKYKIQASTDGIVWTDILRVFSPLVPVDEREFPPGNFQYLRYVATLDHATVSSGEASWTLADISEIEIFEKEAGSVVSAPITYASPIERKNWKVTFSSGETGEVIIANPDQGWFDIHGGGFYGPPDVLIKKTPSAGDWCKIDLGSAQTFNQFFAQGEHSDFEDYELFVSDDDKNWGTPIASGSLIDLGGFRLPINFPMQTKRYLKIVRLESGEGWWGIRNLALFNTTGTNPIDTADSENIALHKSVTSKKSSAGLLFDGDEATGSDPETVSVDLGSVQKIAKIILKMAPIQTGLWFGIEASDDGVNWSLKQRAFLGTESKRVHPGVVFANYSARYLRFHFPIQEYNGKWVFVNFREIEVYKPRVGGTSTSLFKTRPNQFIGKNNQNIKSGFKINGQKSGMNSKVRIQK